MKTLSTIHLSDVQAVYSGPEGRLWELLMGEQIHIGGFVSSLDLAERAGLGAGQAGVDFCCASGAGMRFLVRWRQVAHMTGVDATAAMVALGHQRSADEGLSAQITFVQADVTNSGLPNERYDFVWGEDAWCYVVDKARLVAETARVLKPKGVVAFTDWMEGPAKLTDEEAGRFLGFMKFPSLLGLEAYGALLAQNGCTVGLAVDTGRFAGYAALYLAMLQQQLTSDALKILSFNRPLWESVLAELRFVQSLAEAGKIMQGLIIAHKR